MALVPTSVALVPTSDALVTTSDALAPSPSRFPQDPVQHVFSSLHLSCHTCAGAIAAGESDHRRASAGQAPEGERECGIDAEGR